ncbi:MAG: NTF2-like N-terminal transpeptidase domain-containing protein [Gordonia sp. (in: high G+C Gram-positive bacteria)]|uniref:NTF2-like N-terminal transpeptidase domain-containing protein n=1 Tax=Gordonia sp. (in: high G+C Gram-positive bacteria) TaxID=84139 RepID=UPI0039E53168
MSMRSWRPATAIIAVASLLLALVACGSKDSDASQAASAYAAAFARQDVEASAAMTSSPSQAADALSETFAGMHPRTVDTQVLDVVDYSDGSATFTLKVTWHWAGDKEFTDRTTGSVRRLSTGWKVQWDTGLIHSGMPVGGHLEMTREDADPAPTVRAASGKPLMRVIPINDLVINPEGTKNLRKSVKQLTDAIAPVAPLVTATVIDQKIRDNKGGETVAVSLRDSDLKRLTADPNGIAGVSVRKSSQLVMTDRRIDTPLEAGLTNYWEAIRDAIAGWQVVLVVPGQPTQKLTGTDGTPGPDVMSTVDMDEQLDLQEAVAMVAQPATIMTFDAKSGAIRGMANNQAASDKNIGADISYPTGTTLDPVFAAVDGATAGKGPDAPNDQLGHLGLDLQLTVPGVSAPHDVTAQIRTADFKPQNFTASILNMGALGISIARSIDHSTDTAPPFVVRGATTKAEGGTLGGVDPAAAKKIADAMKTTAATGDASDIKGAPGLRALVGTNGPKGPGWFVGITGGGRVVVIYCENERSGTAALQVAQKYFRP